MTFLEWNDKLATHFFRPEMAGRQVFLFVTEELLNELGSETGDSWRNFASSVRVGHPWRQPGYHSLCQKALHCFETWRIRGLRYPAYIAYLALFVLAAGKDGDFAPHAYYPRLRTLIGEEGHGMLSSFDRMWELWEGLARWANDEHCGERGLFTYRSVGGWVHVGLPQAQTVLTAQERRALPSVFAAARLDPTSSPPDRELQRVLRLNGGHSLRPRTMEILAQEYAGEADGLGVLLTTVREELEHWDGQVEDEFQPAERNVYGILRLCASLDRVAGTARFVLRCSMAREFPDAGLLLQRPGSGDRFCCEGEILHWSTPLQEHGSRVRVDASRFDWCAGVELREEQLGWRFRLQAAPVRVFLNGEGEGLRGFVEVHQLSPGTPFLLAARSEHWPRLEEWGRASCRQFERVPVRHGLPAGWGLFRAAAAESDERVRRDFPILGFPSALRLRLQGGLGNGRRNAYFRFAMPELLVDGTSGGETVICQGAELRPQEQRYCLPMALPGGAPLAIEVRRGDDLLGRHSFSIIDDFEWQWASPEQVFGTFGESVDPSGVNPAGVAGAMLLGLAPAGAFFSPPADCFQAPRVFFVGPVPGQIISWPGEDFPQAWTPVWAIPLARRGRAVFCGVDPGRPPVPGDEAAVPYGRKKVTLWKDVLYHRRKRIDPPADAVLRRLWKRFQEVAGCVRV